MNQRLHRIVFNRKRGQLMAVCETAVAEGKSAGTSRAPGVAAPRRVEASLTVLGFSVLMVIGAVTVLPAQAQIVSDPSAPAGQRPTVINAGNGVPVINVQTPSAAGVSRNTYSQFDVNAQGAVLNNARQNVQSQLGGWVQGNPWLANGTARVIFNEVNSNDPSRLRGYVEVAGDRAQVVIANPAGISCDGCGFVNASRATLTTGSAVFNGGNLEGYRVERGTVSITGNGLDAASTDYTDVIARAVQVNAGLWARELRVAAGAAQVDAQTLQATPIAASSPAPSFSIDVAQLGGMYAGHIRLIGTEAGVGVRNAGHLGASAGEVTVTADGRIENSGHINASQRVAIDGRGGVANSGSVYAQTDMSVTTQGQLDNIGLIAAQGATSVNAASVRNDTSGVLAAGLRADGTLGTGGALTVSATQSLVSAGRAMAADTVRLEGARLDLQGGEVNGQQVDLRATAGDLDASGATLNGAQTLSASAAQTLRTDGAQVTSPRLQLQAHDLSNRQGELMQSGTGALQVTLAGSLDNTGGRVATQGDLDVSAQQAVNRGGRLQAGTAASLGLTVTGAFDNGQSGDVRAGRDVSVTAGSFDNTQGQVSAGQHLTMNAGTLNNQTGLLLATEGLRVSGTRLDNASGVLRSGGALSIQLQGSFANGSGQLFAQSGLSVRASEVQHSGSWYTPGDLRVETTGALVNDGVIAAQGDVAAQAGSLASGVTSQWAAGVRADGTLGSQGDLSLDATGSLSARGTNLAAGDLHVTGARIDVTDARIEGRNVALSATTGDLDARHSSTVATDTLAATAAQALRTDGADLSASQLRLAAHDLSNVAGRLVHSGTGNMTLAVQGQLDNTSGQVTTNARDVTLSAQTLVNAQGRIAHAGTGTLSVASTTFYGNAGRVATNGALALTAQVAQLDGASTSAERLRIDTATLSNRGGEIVQTGNGEARVTATTLLDNTGGLVASQGASRIAAGALVNAQGTLQSGAGSALRVDTTGLLDNANGGQLVSGGSVAVNAGTLDNRQGLVTAATTAALSASGAVDNRAGRIASTGALSLTAASVDNTGGTLQTADSIDLRTTDAFGNQQGQVFAASGLSLRAGELNNGGSVYTQGRADLMLTGALHNAGVLAAQGTLAVQAQRVENMASGLLAAGLRADGSPASAGDLSVTATGDIASQGEASAAGTASFSGASLQLAGSRTQANDVTLRATQSALSTREAVVVATGTLTARAAQALDNDEGELSAQQLDVQAASLSNVDGRIAQTGSGDTSLVVAGSLDNTRGELAFNSTNLTLGAQTLTTVDGRMQHAGLGTWALTATTLDATRGTLAGNGTLSLSATNATVNGGDVLAQRLAFTTGTLSNVGGRIVQSGTGAASLQATTRLDNTGGLIASNGSTTLTVGALVNQRGTVQVASAGSLTVQASGVIDNVDGGQLLAAGALTLAAASLDNTDGRITAGQALQATTTQALVNADGVLAANGDVTLTGSHIDNTRGTAASVHSDLRATASTGSLANDQGRIEAANAVSLTAGGLTNTAGAVNGGDVTIDTGTQAIDNAQGTVAARGTLGVDSGALNNDQGVLQAGGALRVDTHGQALTNTRSGTAAGILGGGAVTLTAGAFDNEAGFIGSQGAMSVQGSTLANTLGGLLVSQSTLSLQGTALDNRGGQVQALGDATVDLGSGTLDNTASLLRAGGTLTLRAAQIVNANTQGADQGLEGRSVDLTAASLDNRSGAMHADQSLAITATGQVDNRQGVVSSTQTLQVRDTQPTQTLALSNTGGLFIAGQRLGIDAAQDSGDGRLLSQGDLSLRLSGDHTLTGTVQANGALTVRSGGTLTQHGTLASGTSLDVAAANLDNTATGEISAAQTRIDVSGTLTNRGLIDGQQTWVTAGTLTNLGTGRLYGDHLAVGATTLTNDVEGGQSAVIAARTRLDVAAQTLTNREHALLFSAGDLAIGGMLDSNQRAAGQAGTVDNLSATIEAMGQLDLAATTVNNRDLHLATTVVSLAPQSITEYQGSWSPNRYLAGTAGVYIFNDESDHLRTPEGDFEQWSAYTYTRNTTETRIASADPARLLSGGAMRLAGGTFNNQQAWVLAGGTLQATLGTLNNEEAAGERVTSDNGTVTSYWRHHQSGRDTTGSSSTGYQPADVRQTIALSAMRYEQNAVPAGSGTQIVALDGHSVTQSATGASAADADLRAGTLIEVRAAVSAVSAVSAPSTATVGPAAGSAVSAAPTTVATNIGTIAQPTALQPTQVAAASTVALSTSAGPVANTTPVLATNIVIRAVVPDTRLPANSLFRQNPAANASVLVETDPRFTDHRTWLSSDYLLQQLGLDPAATHKRMGDGFYEQKLVRDQVAQLTGRRFLDGYADDEAQYQSLMAAGLTHAKSWQLVPGVALTPEQMAQLTTDIVWLVEKPVTLADGSVQKVLVPQVYARLKDGDLSGSGALLSGENLAIDLSGDLRNTGTLAGRSVVNVTAENLRNLGGRIGGAQVALQARTDLDNLGGSLRGDDALLLSAGRDINVVTTTAEGANAQSSHTRADRLASLYVGNGTLVASAGRDINLTAASVVNEGTAGITRLSAARDLNLGTITETSAQRLQWDATNTRQDASRQDLGTVVRSAGALQLAAGQDLNARAATITNDQGPLSATAGRDVNLRAGESNVTVDEAHRHTGRSGLAKQTITTRDTLDRSTALGTTLSGETLAVQAGRDLTLQGSNAVSTQGTLVTANNDVRLEAAIDTQTESHLKDVQKSGWMSGGLSVTYGTRQQTSSNDGKQTSASASTVGSTDGSVVIQAGNAYRQVGSDVVANRGDVDISARSVDVVEAQTTGQDVQETKFKQSGLTIALSAPVISAVQGVQRMSQASGKTGDSRMKALAAANGAMSAYDAAGAAGSLAGGGDGGGVSISITVGSTQNESRTTVDRTGTAGSSVRAGGDVRVQATGGGADSDLTVRGSQIEAGGNVGLKADGDLQLLAAQDSVTQRSQNSSSSANVGVAISLGQGGVAFGVTASASKGRGHADGADVSQVNTHITAGQRVDLDADGDARLAGAVVNGEQVRANVGGDLSIESLQDTSRYASKQESLGGSVTAGAGFSGSANFNKSKVNADYASVVEQSGIRAGDGGFQVAVKGNTDLQGGVISSTQAAIDAQKNTLQTATLSTSDIENRDRFSASSVGLSGGYGQSNGTKDVGGVNMQAFKGGMSGTSMGVGRSSGSQSSMTRAGVSEAVVTLTDEAAQQARTGQTSSEVVASLNREVATGVETSGALRRAWDGQALQEDVQAQTEIVATFGSRMAKEIGDYANKEINAYEQAQLGAQVAERTLADPNATPEQRRQAEDLLQSSQMKMAQEQATYDQWKEGGTLRVAAHAAVGALTGGTAGLLGATASATAAPALDTLQSDLGNRLASAGMDADSANAIGKLAGGAMAVAIGSGVGGSPGAMASFNEDFNNRQLHPQERDWSKKNAKKFQQFLSEKTGEIISSEEAYQRLLSAGYAMTDAGASKVGHSDETAKQFINQTADRGLFVANATERANPFLNGNADNGYSPEQQARFGRIEPGHQAQAAVSAALDLIDKPCTDCREKFRAVEVAVRILEEAKILYQDDASSVKLIDQQVGELKAALTKDEAARGAAGVISDTAKDLAGLALGVPSRVAIGAGTAELLERVALTQGIKDLRATLPNRDLRNSGNIAIAHIDIQGLPTRMAASSRVDEPANGLIGNGSGSFEYLTLPNTKGDLIKRNIDSEYKILDNIADLLGNQKTATGTIRIVTERPACESCLDVATQFRQRYPKIEVKIFDNNGVTLNPTRVSRGKN